MSGDKPIDYKMANWLNGQIEAVRKLAEIVAGVLVHHSIEASKELNCVQYACNRAETRVNECAKRGAQ